VRTVRGGGGQAAPSANPSQTQQRVHLKKKGHEKRRKNCLDDTTAKKRPECTGGQRRLEIF